MKWFKKYLSLSYSLNNLILPFRRIDSKDLTIDNNEIILFAVLRNESLRLPHFINYYKSLGVDRFIFVDNGSTDNSQEIILKEESAHLFYTEESYEKHWYWLEYLLEMYGKGHWCIVVDIDELFTFPNANFISLPSLIEYFELYTFTSINSILLDMYSLEGVSNSKNLNISNPLEILQFFDNNYYKAPFTFFDKKNNIPLLIEAYSGGMRERVFGKMNPLDILTKISLFKYEKDVYLVQGMHAISNTKPADIEGVVFHTKFLSDFIEEVNEESEREQHWNNAIRYKHYKNTISKKPNLKLHYEGSIKFKNNEQLINLGLMKTSNNFENYCNTKKV